MRCALSSLFTSRTALSLCARFHSHARCAGVAADLTSYVAFLHVACCMLHVACCMLRMAQPGDGGERSATHRRACCGASAAGRGRGRGRASTKHMRGRCTCQCAHYPSAMAASPVAPCPSPSPCDPFPAGTARSCLRRPSAPRCNTARTRRSRKRSSGCRANLNVAWA